MSVVFDINNDPHKRLNILTGDWVLVSPHRSKRPWSGKVETVKDVQRPAYDPGCYLCPTNTRVSGAINPDYKGAYIFKNDHSALLEDTPDGEINIQNVLQAKSQRGICKVICFSPNHNETLSSLSVNQIKGVVELMQQEFRDLSKNKWIRYIQIFENKGEIMGCSNPHPHGQIWSSDDLPVEIIKETKTQLEYYNKHHSSLLSFYLSVELEQAERIVHANDHFVALVPFWAVWPFETMIISRRHVEDITQFNETETLALADILHKLSESYDNLFQTSFPYSAGMHQRPVNDGDHPEWHWHMHFYPPLLRSATVKKFMVGYEMLANPQRDITPEFAARRLRESGHQFISPEQ
ncbi:galactose-1-phosphate uridylyltransferase [mine drainage metagenome]|uniref:UDP-glucose--hexose-1-phosphate uridylyltransferase n=1 Tax=mine drainage metagenome TaxID=410659 RepID=A0A1J5S5P5_9ZZZZ